MDKQLLEKPFPEHQVKHRKGNFGNTLAYVEGHAVIKRLNDAFDTDWSFRVARYEILENEVLVMGEIAVGEIVKNQFGSSPITRAKATGEPISIVDDLKAAATDSLKKAATLLGVGNYLYAGGQAPGQNQHPFSGGPQGGGGQQGGHLRAVSGGQPGAASSGALSGCEYGQGHSEGSGGRISSKQLGYIRSLAKKNGLSYQDLTAMSLGRFQAKVEFISSREASFLISELMNSGQERRVTG